MPGLSLVFDAPRTANVSSCHRPTISLTEGSGLGLNFQPPVTIGVKVATEIECRSGSRKNTTSSSGCSSNKSLCSTISDENVCVYEVDEDVVDGHSIAVATSPMLCYDLDLCCSTVNNHEFFIYPHCDCPGVTADDDNCLQCEECLERNDVWKYFVVKPRCDLVRNDYSSLRMMVLYVPDKFGKQQSFQSDFVSLLEHAEEDLHCSWISVVMEKSHASYESLKRTLKFSGMNEAEETSQQHKELLAYIPAKDKKESTVIMLMKFYEEDDDDDEDEKFDLKHEESQDEGLVSSGEEDDWESEFFFR